MRFQVIGASAESGDDVNVLVEAPSQVDVEKIAHDRGIMVSSITPVAGTAAHGTAVGVAVSPAPAPMHAPAAAHAHAEDPNAIALVDDDPPASPSNGNGAHHERPHGIITTNANTPSDTAHSAEGHAHTEKHDVVAAEYHIIMNQSLYLLESAVNKHLRDGWDVAGGMSVATANNALQYFQAMIRRKKPA